MKSVIKLILILVLNSSSFAFATESFRPQYPPFYTMSFEEVSNLMVNDHTQANWLDQRGYYLKNLLPLLNKLLAASDHPFTAVTSVQDLSRLTFSDEGWNKLQADVYYACQEKPRNAAACEGLLSLRNQTWDLLTTDHSLHLHQ